MIWLKYLSGTFVTVQDFSNVLLRKILSAYVFHAWLNFNLNNIWQKNTTSKNDIQLTNWVDIFKKMQNIYQPKSWILI